jgi:hypothetical protein
MDEAAAQRFRDFLDTLVARLVADKPDQITELVRTVRTDPGLSTYAQSIQDIAVMVSQARHAATRAVMESFKDDLGTVVTVDFRDGGSVPVSIRRLETMQVIGTRMSANKRVALGRVEFSVSDLSAAEMMRRMQPASRRPSVAFALGMMHLRQGNPQMARELFLRVQPDLRDALLRYIDRSVGAGASRESARPPGLAPVPPATEPSRRPPPESRRGRRRQP